MAYYYFLLLTSYTAVTGTQRKYRGHSSPDLFAGLMKPCPGHLPYVSGRGSDNGEKSRVPIGVKVAEGKTKGSSWRPSDYGRMSRLLRASLNDFLN